MKTSSPSRETTIDERMKWGECPVCSAKHGESCHAEVGAHLGVKASGGRMNTGEGVHLGRIQNAPKRVQLVPVK